MSNDMPKALEVDWLPIQLDYQKGTGSLRELSIKYQVGLSALEGRCRREGWVKQMQEFSGRVSAKMVESVANMRVKQIQDHESLVIPIAETLIKSVLHSHDSMHGEPIDSSHLQGLAMALKTANSVARLNLGAVDPGQRIDITTNGESLHNRSIELLNTCKKLVAEGKVDATTIDVEGIVKSLEVDRSTL